MGAEIRGRARPLGDPGAPSRVSVSPLGEALSQRVRCRGGRDGLLEPAAERVVILALVDSRFVLGTKGEACLAPSQRLPRFLELAFELAFALAFELELLALFGQAVEDPPRIICCLARRSGSSVLSPTRKSLSSASKSSRVAVDIGSDSSMRSDQATGLGQSPSERTRRARAPSAR